MFPTQEATTTENLTSSNNEISITGKSFLFDFSIGDFVTTDGKLTEITGLEALKMWIIKVLKTDKNKYSIYDGTNYGTMSLIELVSSDYPLPFIKSEVERIVNETLLKNSAIKSLGSFVFERDKRTLKATFAVYTIYGQTESEVII